jgi:signal transduction histidine kinase
MRVSTDSGPTVTYELPPTADQPAGGTPGDRLPGSLPEPVLLDNVRWFIRLRWIAIGLLAAFGAAAAAAPEAFVQLGLRPPRWWPWLVAGVLLAANLAFAADARAMLRRGGGGSERDLWAQILVDLLSLTLVVHQLGSLETPAPFMYLGHVVLACIFFSRRQSRAVALIASSLYAGVLALEHAGVISGGGIYSDAALRRALAVHQTFDLLMAAGAVAIFFVVWFLASHLSALVRRRDIELAEANRRLTAAQREKTGHMLRTTHELKAPFAAIAANAQLLLRGNCGTLSAEATEVVGRIAARCRRLALEIQEMLQLANLQSAEERPTPAGLDLAEVARWALARVGATAQERRVRVEEALEPASVVGVEDHLKMLATNIVNNAVVYSHEGGRVRVACGTDASGAALFTVEDEGIGIPAAKLPRIFEDYYRTEEAARHNKDSTGLGLAIVRHVAQAHGIRVRVESAPGRGTTFTLRFPPA